MRALAWVFGGPRRLRARAAARRGSRSGRSSAAADPPPAAAALGLDAIRDLKPLARAELPRLVAAGGERGARRDARAHPRGARAATPPPEPAPRDYRDARDALAAPSGVELFCERVADYRAEVRRVAPTSVAAVDRARARCARRTRASASRRASAPRGARAASSSSTTTALDAAELDALDGVVTGCTAAIAETGTIVLAGGARAKGAARSRSCPTCTSASSRRADRRARARGDAPRRASSCGRSDAR